MRRHGLILAIAALAAFAGVAAAGTYPTRAVTIICPYSPGGGNDLVARFLADELQKLYKVPFNVVNRTGGNGVVGHSAIAKARPDGYTIGNVVHDITTLKLMGMTELEPKDFEFITQITANYSSFVVRNDSPFKNVRDLIDGIKANPGQLRLAGTSVGGPYDLMRLTVMKKEGLKADDVKFIPNKGASAALVEIMGGHADFTIVAIPEAISQLQSGDLVALSVSSADRNPNFPSVPTLREQGVDVAMGSWITMAAPLDTPQEILDDLQEKFAVIMKSDAFKDFLEKNAFIAGTLVGKELKQMAIDTTERYKEIMEYAGYLKK